MASAGTPYRLVPAHFYPWGEPIVSRIFFGETRLEWARGTKQLSLASLLGRLMEYQLWLG